MLDTAAQIIEGMSTCVWQLMRVFHSHLGSRRLQCVLQRLGGIAGLCFGVFRFFVSVLLLVDLAIQRSGFIQVPLHRWRKTTVLPKALVGRGLSRVSVMSRQPSSHLTVYIKLQPPYPDLCPSMACSNSLAPT